MSTTLPNLVSTELATANSTFNNSTTFDIPENIKTASYVVTSVMLLYTLYLSVGMIAYGTKWKKWQIKKKSGQIYIGCFTAVFLGFLNILVHLLQTAVIEYRELCVMSGHLDNIFGVLAIFSIYVFLWMRQKVIYDSPMVESFTHKSVKVISWLLLIATLGFMAQSIIVLMVLRAERQMTDCLIYFQGNTIVFAFTIVSQIIYCVLFVYPMIKIHLARQKNSRHIVRETSPHPTTEETNVMNSIVCHDTVKDECIINNATNEISHYPKETTNDDNQPRSVVYTIPASTDRNDHKATIKGDVSKSKGKLSKHAARLNKTVRRCLICTIVTVITDAMFIIASEVTVDTIPDKYHRKIVNNIMFDIDIIVNGTAILSTFTGFIDIVTFWMPKSWRKPNNDVEISTSQGSGGG